MTDDVRLDSGGFISGPMEVQPKFQRPIVGDAVSALRTFAGSVDRRTARALLKHWVRHPELSSKDCATVILTFLGDEAHIRECDG